MQSLNSPYVIGFKFFKEFTNYLWLGMELCQGGNLTEWIIRSQKSKSKDIERHEEDCAKILKHILQGVQYIHYNHEIIHRDLKPGNILFKNDDLSSVKIWDFGLANTVGVGFFDQNSEKVGTVIYQAPEQMQSISYGKAVDIWAVGMIMYELLTKGGHPELGDNIHEKVDMSIEDYIDLITNIDSSYKIAGRLIKNFSKLAKNLMRNLWNPKPNRRYNAQRSLKHPWITRNENDQIPLNIYEELQQNMIDIENGICSINLHNLETNDDTVRMNMMSKNKHISAPLSRFQVDELWSSSDTSEDEKYTLMSTKSIENKSTSSNKSNTDTNTNSKQIGKFI